MYIVTVEFLVRPEHAEDFRQALGQQAQNSRTRETDCQQFDVGVDPQAPERILLYEVYTDEAAFKAHLQTEHFQQFDATVRDWVESKAIQFWDRLQT